MLDPYRMVVVNILSSVLVILIIITFKYSLPKKKINFLYLLSLISLLPLISIFRKGVYESGDFVDHIKATMQFYLSMDQGNIIPRLTNLNCNGYTCPDFVFHYLSPHYIMSFFHFVGLNFIASEKLFLILAFFFSGITMFYWLKSEFNNRSVFVGSIVYLFAPYHLVDLHFRTDVGELLCFAILPFCFLCIKRLIEDGKNKYFFSLIFAIFILILSHQAISLISMPFLLGYALLIWLRHNKKNISELRHSFFAIFMGIFLSAFYWLPILLEKKYIYWGSGGKIDLLPIQDLLYSPYRYGFLFQGHYGELSHLIGYAQLFIVLSAIFLLAKNKILKNDKTLLILFLSSFFILFFLMLDISYPLWVHIPFIKFFGFGYRLLLFETLFVSFVAAVISKYIKSQTIIILLISFTILSTILNWGNRKTIPTVDDKYLLNELKTENTGKNNLTLPIWVKGNYYYENGRVEKNLELVSGNAKLKEIRRTTNDHEYLISAEKLSVFQENTYYYPGWNLYVNNKTYPILDSPDKPGTMSFILPKGLHDVEFRFEDTPDRTWGKNLSGVTMVILILYVLSRRIITKRHKLQRSK